MTENKKSRIVPFILTAAASAGVIATAILAAKAAPKAKKDVEKFVDENPEKDVTVKDIVTITWKYYVPTASVCVATIICITGANAMAQRDRLALTSMLGLAENAYNKYKDTVKKVLGTEAHQKVVNAMTVEKCETPPIYSDSCFTCASIDFEKSSNPDEERLFYDTFSGRYFESTFADVIKAEYHLNRNFILSSGAVGPNDFYTFLGLEPNDEFDELNWAGIPDIQWIDFNHRKEIIDDNLECYVIEMVFEPTDEYDQEM